VDPNSLAKISAKCFLANKNPIISLYVPTQLKVLNDQITLLSFPHLGPRAPFHHAWAFSPASSHKRATPAGSTVPGGPSGMAPPQTRPWHPAAEGRSRSTLVVGSHISWQRRVLASCSSAQWRWMVNIHLLARGSKQP
jgi:hypothetical protein